MLQRRHRDARGARRFHDGGGGRAEGFFIRQRAQLGQRTRQIKRLVVDGGQNEFTGLQQTGAGQVFLRNAHHHVVDAHGGCAAGAAKADGMSDAGLNFQRDVFKNVPDPGAFFEAPHEAAGGFVAALMLVQTREPGGQPLDEAGQGIGRTFFKVADVDQRFDGAFIRPAIGAAQHRDVEDTDVVPAHGRFTFVIQSDRRRRLTR